MRMKSQKFVVNPSVADLKLSEATTYFEVDKNGLARTINNNLSVDLPALSRRAKGLLSTKVKLCKLELD